MLVTPFNSLLSYGSALVVLFAYAPTSSPLRAFLRATSLAMDFDCVRFYSIPSYHFD